MPVEVRITSRTNTRLRRVLLSCLWGLPPAPSESLRGLILDCDRTGKMASHHWVELRSESLRGLILDCDLYLTFCEGEPFSKSESLRGLILDCDAAAVIAVGDDVVASESLRGLILDCDVEESKRQRAKRKKKTTKEKAAERIAICEIASGACFFLFAFSCLFFKKWACCSKVKGKHGNQAI